MADRHEASKASKISPIDEYRECVAHDSKYEGMHAAARDWWSESLKVFGAHGREKMLSFATAGEKREIAPPAPAAPVKPANDAAPANPPVVAPAEIPQGGSRVSIPAADPGKSDGPDLLKTLQKPFDALAKPFDPVINAILPPLPPNPYIGGQAIPYNPNDPVQAMPWGRPGETVPSKIDDPLSFTRNLLHNVMDEAKRLHTVGDCGTGFRLGWNDLKGPYHMEATMNIRGNDYRWRSATQQGEYLTGSGLFDKFPLKSVQDHLHDGYIVIRPWIDSLVKKFGEDKGDIAVLSHHGMQYNDHSEAFRAGNGRYNADRSYVLVPKGYSVAAAEKAEKADDAAAPPAPVVHVRPSHHPVYGHHPYYGHQPTYGHPTRHPYTGGRHHRWN